MTQAKCSEMSRKLMKIYADQLNGGNSKICWIEDGLDMTELRHFVNFALEGKKGGIVLALSESVNGGFSYVLGSQSEDMRTLSKELNGELSHEKQVDADGKEPNVEMAMEFDKNRFWKLLVETLKEYGK